jgi:hypothetical protein
MKIATFGRPLLYVSFGIWTLSAPVGVCAATDKAEPVVIGEKFQIESKVLSETRTYVVHTPDYYKNRVDAYPVLVLQDAATRLGQARPAERTNSSPSLQTNFCRRSIATIEPALIAC